MNHYDFDIAVFATNEASAIRECINSIDDASADHNSHVSVMLNGTTDNSVEILERMKCRNASVTVYRFPIADKANAINHFLYNLRRNANVYFCIDGHVRITAGSLQAMRTALTEHPHAHVASSIQLTGRSAKRYAMQVLRGGAITGQFFALRPAFIDKLIGCGFRLPLQIYRGDSLLGSMAAHDLDALGAPWDDGRIIGVADAGFMIRSLSPFRLRDVRRQFHREIRQARGAMENEAVKSIIYTGGYAALPDNANQMLRAWLASNQPRPRSLRQTFFMKLALRQLAQSATIDSVPPKLLYDSEP